MFYEAMCQATEEEEFPLYEALAWWLRSGLLEKAGAAYLQAVM